MDPIRKGFRGEAAEYWRIHNAHALCSQHVEDLLWDIWQVEGNTIARHKPEILENLHTCNDFLEQNAITEMLFSYRTAPPIVFRGVPAITFEDNRGFVCTTLQKVPIYKVETRVGLPTGKPAEVGSCRLIENR